MDEETGYSYFGARYYDPMVSHWISTDPAFDDYLPKGDEVYFPEQDFNANSLKGSGGVFNSINNNLYQYAFENPVRFTDPDGLSPCVGACIAAAVGFLIRYGPKIYKYGKKGYKYGKKYGKQAYKYSKKKGKEVYKWAKDKINKKKGPKKGSKEGPGEGKPFSKKVKDQAEKEAKGKCVFCKKKTTRKSGKNQRNTDHAIPKSRKGNNSAENAQNTCRSCNQKKGTKTTEEYLNK